MAKRLHPEPAGLYLAQATGDQFENVDGVTIAPLSHPDGGLTGGLFEFRGWSFVIWLSKEPLDSFIFASSGGTEFGPGKEELTYHPRLFQIAVRRIITHKLFFEWDQ